LERSLGIISIFDKEGIVDFCRRVSPHYQFISTGKTATLLATAKIPVKTVSSLTSYPEILDGLVKTLHPVVLGGILGTEEQQKELEKLGIQPFGLVVVNLYPFEQVISKPHDFMDALENIDIGGVTLLRAAAKNYREVIVVSSQDDYTTVAEAITADDVSPELRKNLARKAFAETARYDAAINRYLSSDELFPPDFLLAFENPQVLRYGENSHQEARYYLTRGKQPFYRQVHGRSVSFNNVADFYAAIGALSDHKRPSCAIIKHTSPCGFASADDVETAYDRALATDTLSAFGSVVGFNQPVTESLASKLHAVFVDAIIAPAYDEGSFQTLTKKPKLILCTFDDTRIPELSLRLVPNGVLVQERDSHIISKKDLKVASKKSPSAQQLKDLLFAWKVVKYVKSNAAVIGRGEGTLGIGMGQPSRIGAVELALRRAGRHAEGAVMASDGFFPYRDSIDAAVKEGVVAIIAPSGSIRDNESVEAADEAGISLVWSGHRAFLH